MKALAPQATGAVADAITALNKKTVAIAGEPPEAGGRGGRGGRGGGGGGGGGRGAAANPGRATFTQVSGELSALYALMDSADADPTAAQAAELPQVDAIYKKLMAQWTQIKTKDVPALNEQLKKAGLPPLEIKVAAVPPTTIAGPLNAVP